MYDNLRLAERRLDRLGRFEDFREFFEGATARFNIEEVNESELEHVPKDKEEVVLRSSQRHESTGDRV